MSDYFRQIIESKEIREKEYWAHKWWSHRYDWIMAEKAKTRQESASTLRALKEAVIACEEPSFALPLVTSLFKGSTHNREENMISQHEENFIESKAIKPQRRCNKFATTNRIYGMSKPIEEGGANVRRVNYSTQRKIGYWNETNEKASP